MDRTPRDPVHRPEGMVASILPTEPTDRRDVTMERSIKSNRKTALFEKISPNLVEKWQANFSNFSLAAKIEMKYYEAFGS